MGPDTGSGEAIFEALRFAWPGLNLENIPEPEGAISCVFCVAARSLSRYPSADEGTEEQDARGRIAGAAGERIAGLSARQGSRAHHDPAGGDYQASVGKSWWWRESAGMHKTRAVRAARAQEAGARGVNGSGDQGDQAGGQEQGVESSVVEKGAECCWWTW